jgi:hypothetical protein
MTLGEFNAKIRPFGGQFRPFAEGHAEEGDAGFERAAQRGIDCRTLSECREVPLSSGTYAI